MPNRLISRSYPLEAALPGAIGPSVSSLPGPLQATCARAAQRDLAAVVNRVTASCPTTAQQLREAQRELARQQHVIAEAAEVREMAWNLRRSDPGFAADLAAAADRHERCAPT